MAFEKKHLMTFVFCHILLQVWAGPSVTTKFITIDQFGYLPNAQKIAVIRDPQFGFDGAESFTPGTSYQIREWFSDSVVFTANIVAWNGGLVDSTSGDKTWRFDFSTITRKGEYYVFDPQNNVGSYRFRIANDVYNEVLKHAVRTFYYQRSGTPKLSVHAGVGWADDACFLGNLQDKNCRLYSDKNNAATERDLSGGWFDAGDYNKYTTFLWDVVPQMLSAYEENPRVWADDYNIPESGNGIPDLLDEIKWELDWLLKMQQTDGSVFSIVGVGITESITGGFKNANASPPSATTGQSLYGPATTDATYMSAALFAYGAKIYRSLNNASMNTYANKLEAAAVKAWTWANANPSVKWRNNDAAYNSKGIGAGQSDKSRGVINFKVGAACYLYALTGQTVYKTSFEENYVNINMIKWTFAYMYESSHQDMLLYYTKLPNITPSVRDNILSKYVTSLRTSPDNLPSLLSDRDPYRGFIPNYVWGSNSFLCRQGGMHYNMLTFNQDSANHTAYKNGAYGVINKMHGINPMGLVYLTNMGSTGAEKSCTQVWHTWFRNGSAKWDEVGVSEYGPPPGYIPGGPNSSYKKDACCASGSCGSTSNNALCDAVPNLPVGQPRQKSYLDFNHNWPVNGWELTENAIYYQAAYIKLLSKFIVPSTVTSLKNADHVDVSNKIMVYPNPSQGNIRINSAINEQFELNVINVQGQIVGKKTIFGQGDVDLNISTNGIYFLRFSNKNLNITKKVIVNGIE